MGGHEKGAGMGGGTGTARQNLDGGGTAVDHAEAQRE